MSEPAPAPRDGDWCPGYSDECHGPELRARIRALERVAAEARKVSESFAKSVDDVNAMIDWKLDWKPGEIPMKRDQGFEALNAALEGLK